MTKVTLEPVGVYKNFTDNQAQEYLAEIQALEDDHIKDQLNSLYLIEVNATNVNVSLQGQYLYQSENWVWYSEEFIDLASSRPIPKPKRDHVLIEDDNKTWKVYLDDRERELASDEDLVWNPHHPTDGSSFGIVFFLHHYNLDTPLKSPYGDFKLPAPTDLPDRLKWKKYVNWG